MGAHPKYHSNAEETVKTSLRNVLAESHVAPIAIAILMARAIVGMVDGLALPIGSGIFSAVVFVLAAITEREMPSAPRLDFTGLLVLTKNIGSSEVAATCAIAAWLLARLVFGTGPIRFLRTACSEIRGGLYAASLEKSAGR
jgi:hypothetical protein